MGVRLGGGLEVSDWSISILNLMVSLKMTIFTNLHLDSDNFLN